MIIHKIQMDGFGKFSNKILEFDEGIQVIYGENESGKSTCKQFIVSMLYDVEKLRGKGARTDEYHRYEPRFTAQYGGMMEFSIHQKPYRLYRQFQKEKQRTTLHPLQEETLIVIEGAVWEYFDLLSREQYFNTLCMQGDQLLVGNSLKEELNRYSRKMMTGGTAQFDVETAIQSLQSKKQSRFIKIKEQEFVDLKIKLEKNRVDGNYQQLLKEEVQLEEKIDDLKRKLEIGQEMQLEENNTMRPKKKLLLSKIEMGILGVLCIILMTFCLSYGEWKIFDIFRFFCVLFGSILLFLKKNYEKNLPDTRSVVQLEKILLCQEDREQQIAQITFYEKELLQNRMAQKYEKERENTKQEIEEQYQRIRQEIHKAEEKNKAIELAISTLRNVSSSIYSQFGRSFNEELSSVMRMITDGRCKRVFVDEKLGIQIEQNGTFFGVEQLSLGTVEQIYFAIRIVTGKLLSKGEMLPILLDDVFGNFDDKRLRKIISFLKQNHYPQIIIFTCNQRICDVLRTEQIKFSYIEL